MTTTTGKIGFHFGSQSQARGYGEYVRELDSAGIPATVMSVGGEGFGDIKGVWDNGSTVPHVAVIRCLSHNDVPRYDLPIDDAVADWLDRYCPTIGPDVIQYHERTITKHGNELDRNKIVWLADFYIALHPRFLDRMGWQQHQICIFNFAGGNPDPDQWELIIPQLKIFADNPDKFIVGCHEYSFDDTNIWNTDGGGNLLIGRFKYLFDTCDANNIKRPLYAIHEWGWRDKKIPDSTNQSMSDIDAVNELYCKYPEIIGAGIWTLQKWQGSGINLEVEKLIPPVKELTLNKRYEVVEGEEEMDCNDVVRESYNRVYHVASPTYCTPEERKAITDRTLDESDSMYGQTVGLSFDDAGIGAECLKSALASLWQITEDKKQVFRDWYAENYPQVDVEFRYLGQSQSPVGNGFNNPVGTSENPSTANVYPAQWISAVTFGMLYNHNGSVYHTGDDLNLNEPAWDSDALAPTYALEDGRVVYSGVGYGTWGNVIVIEYPHQHFGKVYSRHAHLDERRVELGAPVLRGQEIGRIGNAGGQVPYHLHFDIFVTELGAADPLNWPKTDLDFLTKNYICPESFIRLCRPDYAWPEIRDGFISRNVNFRVRPTSHAMSTIMRVLQQGTAVSVLNQLDSFFLVQESGNYGWVHEDFLAFSPPASGGTDTGVGLHWSADHDNGIGWEQPARLEMLKLKPDVIKFLSFHNPSMVSLVAADNKDSCDIFIVRAFLDWGTREVTPQMFIDGTLGDTMRTVNAIVGQGVAHEEIIIEIHNEMNLQPEGWSQAWGTGRSCMEFFKPVIKAFRAAMPNCRYGIGGLSPGGDIGGVRAGSDLFMSQMIGHPSWDDYDTMFAHVYTVNDWYGPHEISWIDSIEAVTHKPIYISESSYHSPIGSDGYRVVVPGAVYAAKLAELIELLDERKTRGVAFYCMSASNEEFRHESWVISEHAQTPNVNVESRGIASALRALIPA